MPDAQSGDARAVPWFAGKDVPVLIYRINRRELPQANLLTSQPTNFIDHLTECLLFGQEVVTAGHGSERRWKLGNRNINERAGYVAGRIGYRSPDSEEQDDYDEANAEWVVEVVATERKATAPFVVAGATRLLLVAKHPTFAEGTLAAVFEMILQNGEQNRQIPTTEWAVEPILDRKDFTRWLQETPIVETITFDVRLPNPDAAESFAQLDQYMRDVDAAKLTHTIAARDPSKGLNKDLSRQPLGQGLLAMAERSFATIRARGRSSSGKKKSYNQKQRVRREPVAMPDTYEGAEEAITDHALAAQVEDTSE